MDRHTTGRPAVRPVLRRGSFVRHATLALLGAALLAAAAPRPADAQFGALRKLKELKDAVSGPDSAARVKDSLAKIQATANGEVALPDTGKKSFFSRAKDAATKVSDKVESTTGISVKDAALAASGVGIAGIAAKKLGVDPASVANNLVNKATDAAQKKAGLAAGAIPGLPGGIPGAASLQAMQAQSQAMQSQAAAMQGKALKAMGSPNAAAMAMLGAMPDAQLMIAFQQSMSQVAMEATSGNLVARAKMEAWSNLAGKYEAQAQKLTAAASAGDMAAIGKLQALQVTMMREWLNRYGAKP